MKDPTGAIYDSVYGILNGRLAYGGNTYDVYTIPPKDKINRYVLIDNLSFKDASTGNTNDYECLLQILIEDSGVKRISTNRINSISSQVFNILLKRKWQIAGFEITSGPLLDNTEIVKFNTETEIILNKTIILTFNIQEE